MKNHNFINVALVGGLALVGAVFAPGARAGEGGIAGSAAFTIVNDQVTGVAVSSAVGKQVAAAQAFNYGTTGTLQNAAFAIGVAGTLSINGVGDVAGSSYNSIEDIDNLGTAQANTFSPGTVGITLGTVTGNTLVTSPLP